MLTKRIAGETLSELQKEGLFIFPEAVGETDDLDDDQMILQKISDGFSTGNVMGFIGYRDERLVIRSRFSDGESDYFLQYLLSRVLNLPDIIDLGTGARPDEQFFQLLPFLFPLCLQNAMRKGIYKTYIRRYYNNENVRGTIDIARHIKENTPFTGKVAYSQREYSYDNALTELIRHTIEYIQRKPYGQRLLARVKDETSMVIEATPGYASGDRSRVIAKNLRTPVRHAYYREYRNLQRLCLLILMHRKYRVSASPRRVYGILFDGAWLWEEYVNSLVGDIFYHPMNKSGIGAQRLFEGNTGKIYPDFIGKDQSHRLIADAKYKPAENIGSKDYLQVLAYMFRFDAKEGFYFYPESNGAGDKKLRMNAGVSFEKNVAPRDDVFVVKHGLMIPRHQTSYDRFASEMANNEKQFREGIITV